MTSGEAEDMGHASESVASDFEHTLVGMAAEAGLSEADKADGFSGSPQNGSGEHADIGARVDNSAMIMGLPVMMKVVLGSAKMPVATLAKLAKGSVVKLDKMVGDPVDILVNGRLIARGEVVVLNEGSSRFGVVLTQVGGLTPSAK
jgi:flagellar motor switch protein FliN/FliY